MFPRIPAVLRCSWVLIREVRPIHNSPRALNDSRDNGDENQTSAAIKLNTLLKSIVEEEKGVDKSFNGPNKRTVELPKPRARHRSGRVAAKSQRQLNLGERIVDAARHVAHQMGGDQVKTEAELLHKLLYKDTQLKQEILKSQEKEALGEILKSMKVEEKEEVIEERKVVESRVSLADQVRHVMPRPPRSRATTHSRREMRVNLWGREGLGLLRGENYEETCDLATWDACTAHEMRLSVTHPPASYWQHLLHLTDKGIIWTFPINNQQGLEEEKGESFADHVLLESQLEEWCPARGPVRHFMELVCVGLSRNHWLSASEKRDHILWYRHYFADKNHLLQQLGVQQVLTHS